MRTPFVCGNWKMYKTVAESLAFAREARDLVAGVQGVTLGLAAPFTALKSLADALDGSPVLVGAQNCHDAEEGALTGEVSAGMLAEAGCRFVLVGHSERRQLFGETDASAGRKVAAALKKGLTAILCVGESLEERRSGRMAPVVLGQVAGGLAGLPAQAMAGVVIAYEPVWAIGTGEVAKPGQAQEVHALIRGRLGDLYGAGVAAQTRVLYGGSVKPDNIKALMAQPDIDGALVGGASLRADSFAALAAGAAGA